MSVRDRGLLLVSLALSLITCGLFFHRHASTSSNQAPGYTEADVRDFIVPGLTLRGAIIERFGQPIVIENHPKYDDGVAREDERLIFSVALPSEAVNGRNGFAGFSVGVKDGVATDWDTITGTAYKHQ